MKHTIVFMAVLTLVILPARLQAEEDEVAVPVPELHQADDALPGGGAPEAEPAATPAAVPAEAKAPAAPHAPAQPAKVYPPDTVFTVQLGAFQTRERAFALYWELSKKVSPLQVTAPSPKDKLYRVRYGSFPNYAEAKSAAEKLKARGIECFVAPLNPDADSAVPAQEQR